MLRAVSGWSYILQKQLSSVLTDSLSVHAVLKKDNWRDCQDSEQESQRVCHNIMGAVAVRGRQH